MSELYPVEKGFKDKMDGNRPYKVDDYYPRRGLEPSEDRIAFLQDGGYISGGSAKADEPHDDGVETEYPRHVGGGYYELSNGDKVQGKDKAAKAEKEL